MSARATWKGVLKISRVTIPIKVYPATESSESLSFNQLHADCQTRITQRKWCTTCAREVPSGEIVKGFEFEKGRYVILDEAELDAVKPESTRVIDLVQFAKLERLDPIYIDRSYYLAPDGPLAADAFATMRFAMGGTVGIGKLALYGREYLVAVRPQHDVLLLHTLHHAAEIRPHDALEPDAGTQVAATTIALARKVIAAFMGPLNLAAFTDQYQADVRRLIDAKIAGEEIVIPPIADAPAVVNLRDALTASLQAMKKTPVKAKPVKRMRAS